MSSLGTLVTGAGVVMADNALADRARHLEWWQPADHDDDDEPTRLQLDFNPQSSYFYDYSAMDWFSIPRDLDEKWISGPYLDYTGTDLYICTFAVPVRLDTGEFLGVAGADVTVSGIESRLWATLSAVRGNTVLINAEGRVIVGNDADHATGSKAPGRIQSSPPVPVRNAPWSVVELAVSSRGPNSPSQ